VTVVRVTRKFAKRLEKTRPERRGRVRVTRLGRSAGTVRSVGQWATRTDMVPTSLRFGSVKSEEWQVTARSPLPTLSAVPNVVQQWSPFATST